MHLILYGILGNLVLEQLDRCLSSVAGLVPEIFRLSKVPLDVYLSSSQVSQDKFEGVQAFNEVNLQEKLPKVLYFESKFIFNRLIFPNRRRLFLKVCGQILGQTYS